MGNMANYYFIISSLPPLSLEAKPEISFHELKDLLTLNLTAADLKQVEKLLWRIDLANIRALWLGLPIDERGNLSPKELEEALLIQEDLPAFIIDYLHQYESTSDRIRYFSSLFATLYREEAPHLKGFLLQYDRFERELRLNLAALRAKRSGRDLTRELQFEDPSEPLIAEILAQKDAPDFTPSSEFENLKNIFEDNNKNPRKLYLAILQYRFNKIEEMEEIDSFSINRVLAYVARFLIVESWFDLDREQGMIAVEKLSQYG